MADTYKTFYASGKQIDTTSGGTDDSKEIVIIPEASSNSGRELGTLEEIHDLMISASSFSTVSDSWRAFVDVYIKQNGTKYMLYSYLQLRDGQTWHNEKAISIRYNQSLCCKIRSMTSTASGNNNNINISASAFEMKDINAKYYTLKINPTPSDASVRIESSSNISTSRQITLPEGTTVRYTVSAPKYITSGPTTTTLDSNKTINVSLEKYKCLRINTNASNATISLTASGYEQEGDMIYVRSGTSVHWSVSAPHYISQSGNKTVNNDETLTVNLTLENHTFTINPTPNDATVILSGGGSTIYGKTITVPYGTTVNWSVQKDEYKTKTGSYKVLSNYTLPVELELTEDLPAGLLIFESSKAGTYNVTIPKNGKYQIWMVGGGAGGAQRSHTYTWYSAGTNSHYHSHTSYSGSGGGSGALVTGYIQLTAGTYSVSIGGGGSGQYARNTATGGAGGSTTAFGQTAGGAPSHSYGSGGSGGGYNITINTLSGTNGKSGTHGTTSSGGASVYGGYGAGGGTAKTSAGNGGSGYIKITYVERVL